MRTWSSGEAPARGDSALRRDRGRENTKDKHSDKKLLRVGLILSTCPGV